MTEEDAIMPVADHKVFGTLAVEIYDLRLLFRTAFASFIEQNIDCIRRGVSERNLCSRLAMVLEPLAHAQGLTGYRADVEYNRGQGTELKTIVNNRWEEITITCDLILHSRGKLERDNLIAIEMKRASHDPVDKARDRVRLEALTDEKRTATCRARSRRGEHVYGYELGYFVELKRANFAIEEYVGGAQVSGWTIGLNDEPGRFGPRILQKRHVPDLFD
ncbi:MAG: hypothetical protein JNN10_12540 [Sphingopyxis sp.]|uniref:hypothetical protein n=1 Tax=Sphingopyxis sp. TaxID=1908224 RepID=UPI001A515A2E|nr:hypothetical protein [Sphingopyxis sp.]MBL9067113.1 hypothetical protein [Sphingopyxis sp.]